MPSWDTQFSVPLFDRTYTLQEILKKDSLIISNGDTAYLEPSSESGLFEFSQSQQIKDVKVGDQIKIKGIGPTSSAQSPGSFSIESPPPAHFAEVDQSLPVGSTVPVPAISPPKSSSLYPDSPFNNFTSATISSGYLQATLHNGYPATMTFQNGIDVEDSSGNVLLNIPMPGDSLAPDRTVVDTISLAGITLPNNPRAVFTYSSQGSGGTPRTFRSDTLVSISFNLIDVTVSAANAKIPPQPPASWNEKICLADSNMVQSAIIDSGYLNIAVTNQFPFSAPIKLVINSLKDQGGAPLTLGFTLTAAGTPGSIHQQEVSLQGYSLQMADAVGNPSDTVRYTIIADIPGSGNQFVDISTSDSVESSFTVSELKFSSFTGIVHLSGPIRIVPDTQTVNLGEFSKNFSGAITYSDSTKLILDMHKTGGFPWLVHLRLIPSSSTLNLSPIDSAVVEQIVYPDQVNLIHLGPGLVNALNAYSRQRQVMPDRLVISGYIIVNPTFTEGTIQKDDMMSGTAALTMPLNLGISNAVYIDTTKTAVIGDSSTAAKMSNVDSGRVVFEINNGLPLRLSFITQLVDTVTGQVVGELPTDSIIVPAATDFNSDGTVRTPMFSKSQTIITHDQAVELGRSYMRMIFRVLTSPDRSTVLFTKNNTVSVRAYANFAFRVDKNLVGK